jgi:hypothetical protein
MFCFQNKPKRSKKYKTNSKCGNSIKINNLVLWLKVVYERQDKSPPITVIRLATAKE